MRRGDTHSYDDSCCTVCSADIAAFAMDKALGFKRSHVEEWDLRLLIIWKYTTILLQFQERGFPY